MDLSFRMEQNVGVVTVTGRLDALTAADFEKQCLMHIDQGANRLIVDLKDLEYISSAGLRGILSIAKKVKATSGTLCLCGLKGLVEEVIHLSGFSNMMPIYTDVTEALRDCETNGK